MLGADQYEGISLRPCDEDAIHQSKDRLIDRLSETMANRFEDMSNGVLSAMRLTNFCFWPEEDRNDGELSLCVFYTVSLFPAFIFYAHSHSIYIFYFDSIFLPCLVLLFIYLFYLAFL